MWFSFFFIVGGDLLKAFWVDDVRVRSRWMCDVINVVLVRRNVLGL